MKIVIVDLELCQPSGKIIEIGATAVDLKRGVEYDRFDQVCNPGELPDERITELTGITPAMVEAAIPLEEALWFFWNWVTDCQCGRQMGAWGGDVWELTRVSQELGVFYQQPRVQNIKETAKLFRSVLPQSKKSGGLKPTMEAFGLEFQGIPHRAYTDAYNTARLLFHFRQILDKGLQLDRIAQHGGKSFPPLSGGKR